MRFRAMGARCGSTILCLQLVFACAPLKKDDDDSDKEPEVGFFTTASQSSLAVENDIAFLDADFGAILRFTNDPLSLHSSIDIPFDAAKQSFLAASRGRYYLTFKKDGLKVVNKDGTAFKPNFLVDEHLINAAFANSHNLLVLWDELGVVAVQLGDDGSFKGEFRGEATFGSDQAFIAATMLNDGRLVVTAGESEVIIVDLVASIEEQAWQTTTFLLDGANGGSKAATSLTWLAATPYDKDLLLMKDSDRVLLVNVEQQKVIDEVDLSAKHDVRVSRNNIPHLLATDSVSGSNPKSYNLYYVNKKKELSQSIISNVKDGFFDSFLDANSGVIMIRVGKEKVNDDKGTRNDEQASTKFEGSIYRYLLKTGAIKDRTDINDNVRIHMSKAYVYLHFDSPLGKLQRIEYGNDGAKTEIKMFNLQRLRERH